MFPSYRGSKRGSRLFNINVKIYRIFLYGSGYAVRNMDLIEVILWKKYWLDLL